MFFALWRWRRGRNVSRIKVGALCWLYATTRFCSDAKTHRRSILVDSVIWPCQDCDEDNSYRKLCSIGCWVWWSEKMLEMSAKAYLQLPFLSGNVAAKVRNCSLRANLNDDVVLVNIPGNNIKQLLFRIGVTAILVYWRDCSALQRWAQLKKGVVFQIQFLTYSELYIHRWDGKDAQCSH